MKSTGRVQLSRQAEVSYLDVTGCGEEHVLWREISMEHSMLMHVLQTARELMKERRDSRRFKADNWTASHRTARSIAPFFNRLRKSAACCVLLDEVERRAVLERGTVFDDVLVT